ncbi:MAG: UvrD-helicase domain-containing protein [Patescibacteria group bacterium]|jgi:DNA helicase-2/ATP-dependent DNA helicase PcrA
METKDITKNLNPEQKLAVTHDAGPLLIVAGAGTGKTTVITQRIAWLALSDKAKPEEILAVTFTDKAAAEMEERVDRLLPYGYVDLWIATFHSFCERILKTHALDIGLPSDFKIMDGTAQWLLVRQNLAKFNLDYYHPLGNPTKFIHALLKHFSRAKDEMISAGDYLEYAEKLKINLDGMESSGGRTLKHKNIKTKEQKNPSMRGAGKRTKEQDNNSPSEDKSEAVDEMEVKRLNEVAGAYQVYQQLLLDNNALDFGDLINYTLKLFQDRPQILRRYQEQFKYILVDEFQDTNWAQYQLIKLLASPRNNLTVVGDDDQAIYRFRGASLSNILEFKSDYSAAKEVVLTENYRSAQNILDLAYKFIQGNNPNRLECRLNESAAILEQAQKKGVNLKKFKKIDKQLKAANEIGGQIEHRHYGTVGEEVAGVLNQILALKKADPETEWSDFAILVRANASAKPFNAALLRAGVPFQFLALRGLYAKEVILDVLAYFKLLDNYHESPAVWRVLNFPMFKIAPQDLVQLSHQAYRQGWSLYESLQKAALMSGLEPKTLDTINQLLSFVVRHTQLAQEKSVGELLITFLTELGYVRYLKDLDNEKGREDLLYLNQFYKKIKAFEEEIDDPKLKDFLELMKLELESGEEGGLQADVEAGPDVVRVMTIHGAKGLEFKYVFIVNLVHLRFPTSERAESIELPDELVKEVAPSGDIHLEEERRLFYVAATRAKLGLFLTSAEDYGGSQKKKPSRFLAELGYGGQENKRTREQENKETIETVKYATSAGGAAAKLPLPDKFPFSQISSFEKCPLQYKYAYILKIPTFGKPSFSFGSTIHVTLQKFFNQMLEGGGQSDLFGAKAGNKLALPSWEVLLELYEASWVDTWYKNAAEKKEYRDKGRRILKEYYRLISQDRPTPIKLESPFKIAVGPYKISGRVDRIDQVAGGVEIIDYKTGQPKTEVKDDDRDQLLIYQLAAEQAFGLQPQKLTYYYIEENKAVSFIGSEKDKEKIQEKIINIIDRIQGSDFTATPGWPCRFCDFREICEFREN